MRLDFLSQSSSSYYSVWVRTNRGNEIVKLVSTPLQVMHLLRGITVDKWSSPHSLSFSHLVIYSSRNEPPAREWGGAPRHQTRQYHEASGWGRTLSVQADRLWCCPWVRGRWEICVHIWHRGISGKKEVLFKKIFTWLMLKKPQSCLFLCTSFSDSQKIQHVQLLIKNVIRHLMWFL